jgi:hypothetical protein
LPVVQAAVPEACSRTATPTSRFRNSIRSRPPLPPYAPTAPASQSRVSVLCAVISPSPCASPCASHRPSLSVSRLRPLRSHQSLTVCLTVCLPPPQPLSLASPSSAQSSVPHRVPHRVPPTASASQSRVSVLCAAQSSVPHCVPPTAPASHSRVSVLCAAQSSVPHCVPPTASHFPTVPRRRHAPPHRPRRAPLCSTTTTQPPRGVLTPNPTIRWLFAPLLITRTCNRI